MEAQVYSQEYQRTGRSLLRSLAPVGVVLLSVCLVSTIGFVIFAEYTVFEAAYMTVITVGTVGYGEVVELDNSGRIWAIVVTLLGYASLIFTTSTLTGLFVGGEFRRVAAIRRRTKMRNALNDHVIVLGFGRVGRSAAISVLAAEDGCIVIERDPTLVDAITASGAIAMIADATDTQALHDAGIERARGLIAALDDASNLGVILAARSIAPDVRIVTRVNDPMWGDKMRLAGATEVLSPFDSLGAEMAFSASHSTVVGLHDLPRLGLRSTELEVQAGAAICGMSIKTISEAEPFALLLGVRRENEGSPWSHVDILEPGDVILALGGPDALARITSRVSELES